MSKLESNKQTKKINNVDNYKDDNRVEPVNLNTIEIEDNYLVNQVIGQPKAVQAVIDAAKSGRNLLLIGLPGTGKSMLGKALAEILPPKKLYDVISKKNIKDPSKPQIVMLPSGSAQELIEKENEQIQNLEKNYNYMTIFGIVAVLLLGFTFFLLGQDVGLVETLFALLLVITWIMYRQRNAINYLEQISSVLITHEEGKVPFVDASGSSHHILLGDIRHDPYQSGGLETPAHHLIIPGLIHKANGGVLYIDEIGTLDPTSQFYLLTVMQNGELPIEGRSEGSSGSVIKTEPVPCNFTLVAAGNYETVQLLHPALRSRIQGFGMEVLMEKDLEISSMDDITAIMKQLFHQEINDDHITITEDGIAALIYIGQILSLRDGFVSLQFREFGGIIRAAYDLISFDELTEIMASDLLLAFERQLPVEQQMSRQEFSLYFNLEGTKWKPNKLWYRNRDEHKFDYEVVEFIQSELTTMNKSKLITPDDSEVSTQHFPFLSKLGNMDIEPKYNYSKLYLKYSAMSVTEYPASLILGSIRPSIISSDAVIIGSVDTELNAIPMIDITYETYNAFQHGFSHVYVVTSADNRQTKLPEFEDNITIINDFQEFLKNKSKDFEKGD